MEFHYPAWPEEFVELYTRNGCWSGETFGQLLRARAEKYSDKTAIVSEEGQLTYRELDIRADQLAAGFIGIGIKPLDRVVVQLPNIIPIVEIIFALFRIGALPVFSLPMHRKQEVTHLVDHAEAVAYIIPDTFFGFDYRELAREIKKGSPCLQHVIVIGEAFEFQSLETLYKESVQLPETNPNQVAFLQLSGGSTGLPKMIPRTHNDYIYSLRESSIVCELNEDSVYLAVLPVAHNFTLSSPGILGTLYAGGKVVLAQNSSPDTGFEWIKKEKVTITAVVPPLVLVWLEAKRTRNLDLSCLQVLQVGGSKLNADVARKVQPVFGCKLQQVFGMAEGLVNYTRLNDPEEIVVNTQGRPMSTYDEVRIVDDEDCEVERGEVGHLLTRGPYTIRGYYKAEEQNLKSFTKDGFYRTGDLVRMTADGYLIVEGRAKDLINRGGEKISTEDVENYLISHESVYDAALVAMPDPYLGERSCAFIIPRYQNINKKELIDFLRERGLSSYKIPDRIEFLSEFPKTAVGKVSKRALREMLAEMMASDTQSTNY